MKVIAVSVAIALFSFLQGCGENDNKPDETCPDSTTGNGGRVTNADTGFTNNTGNNGSSCVDICLADGAVHPPPENKTGKFDWDVLVLDHMYVSQMCSGLTQPGAKHDLTLTNLEGSSCSANGDRKLSPFTIHGLWPNYNHGFAGCVGSPVPLSDSSIQNWASETQKMLQENWIDPAVRKGCSRCFTWNHEWQKHGAILTQTAEDYFTVGLALHAEIKDAIVSLGDALQNRSGATWTVAGVQQLWQERQNSSVKINVVCDPLSQAKAENGTLLHYFSEFQTCWRRKNGVPVGVAVKASDLVLRDCPPAFSGALSGPCSDEFAIVKGSDDDIKTIAV